MTVNIETYPSQFAVVIDGKKSRSYIRYSVESNKYYVIPDGMEGIFLCNSTFMESYVSPNEQSFNENYGFDTKEEAMIGIIEYNKLV